MIGRRCGRSGEFMACLAAIPLALGSAARANQLLLHSVFRTARQHSCGSTANVNALGAVPTVVPGTSLFSIRNLPERESRSGVGLLSTWLSWSAFRVCEGARLASGEQEESNMKSKLLATVAVAAVVGFGGVAAAQQTGGDSNKSMSGSGATQEKSGGSAQSGSKSMSPSTNQSGQSSAPSRSQSAQEKGGKDNGRLGQGANQEQKGMTRGAQDEKRGMDQKGAQQERGLQKNQKGAEERGLQKNQKGAQEERGNVKGAQEKGAQEKSGTTTKGAQEKSGTTTKGAQEQRGQTGVNVESGGARGGSVQLSQDQRSQIKTVIGRGSGPRLSRSDVSFSISVGTRVPRSVHFVTLPSEIVRIVPQYRGYEYFLVEDEIVIVDPRTLEIVAVIPA